MRYLIKSIDDYNSNDINQFFKYIYKEKQLKIEKIVNKNAKKRSIIAEIMLKELLKEYDLEYSNINFQTNENGKTDFKDLNLHFNISHSYNYIIVVISNNNVGVDIEKIRKTNFNTINFFANNKEKEYILSNDKMQYNKLFEIFTLKEAYIKMKGDSLYNVLNTNINKRNITITNFVRDNYIITICEEKEKEH